MPAHAATTPFLEPSAIRRFPVVGCVFAIGHMLPCFGPRHPSVRHCAHLLAYCVRPSRRDARAYFSMRNTVEQNYAATGCSAQPGDYLSGEAVERREVAFPPNLRHLTPSEFTRRSQHGFGVADATLANR